MIKSPNRHSAFAPSRILIRLMFLALCGMMSLQLSGCLSRPALLRQTFALTSPASADASAKTGTGVLAVRSCTVSPLFANRPLVYRLGPETYEQDPYAGFLVNPSDALAISVRSYLRNSGAFEDVAEPGSLLAADRWLEVYVSELYGDFRNPKQAEAVLTIRFVFFRAKQGGPNGVLLERSFSRRIPLTKNTAAAVVAGWNQALTEIMTQVAADLAAAKS
jgi:cholesterol transport system auxiliary component